MPLGVVRGIDSDAWSQSAMNRKLYVGNLPFETTENDLQTLFATTGNVETVHLVRERETGRARGFAFVEMATDADALNAIATLNDSSVRRPQPGSERSPSAGAARRRQRRRLRPEKPRRPPLVASLADARDPRVRSTREGTR